MHKCEKWIKLAGTVLCELFTVCTIVMLLLGGETGRLAMALVTLLLVALPMLMEKLFACRFSLPLYIFALIYAIGPMLGHCWKLYYTVPVWDKLLHISGGVMFAIVGMYVFDLLVKNKEAPAIKLLFALCFSISVAVLWEFCEFGADIFLGLDTQEDMIIRSVTSFLLGDSVGVTGSIENIESVVVNGVPMPGYIDIGLIDSMLDMLVETVGAAVTCLVLWIDRPWSCKRQQDEERLNQPMAQPAGGA